jgi:hypothetical protein
MAAAQWLAVDLHLGIRALASKDAGHVGLLARVLGSAWVGEGAQEGLLGRLHLSYSYAPSYGRRS